MACVQVTFASDHRRARRRAGFATTRPSVVMTSTGLVGRVDGKKSINGVRCMVPEVEGKKRELEPAQARAALTLDRHISVTAGPGAGKTTVLVERYLQILREKKPASIDQIVAITFTNRAANEMRERLRKALDD